MHFIFVWYLNQQYYQAHVWLEEKDMDHIYVQIIYTYINKNAINFIVGIV